RRVIDLVVELLERLGGKVLRLTLDLHARRDGEGRDARTAPMHRDQRPPPDGDRCASCYRLRIQVATGAALAFASLLGQSPRIYTSSRMGRLPGNIGMGRPLLSLMCRSGGRPSTWNMVAIRSPGRIGVPFGVSARALDSPTIWPIFRPPPARASVH